MVKEIRIHRNTVDLTIHFNTVKELEQQLEDHEKIWQIVEKHVGVTSLEKKSIRKDLEGICDVEDNLIILKRNPKSPKKVLEMMKSMQNKYWAMSHAEMLRTKRQQAVQTPDSHVWAIQ